MAENETNQIFQLIPKIMGEIGAIEKNRKNQAQNYSFRGIDDVYNSLQGPLAKYGVFFVPRVLQMTRAERAGKSGGVLIFTTLKVRYTFFAPDGSSVSVITYGEGMDSGDKSVNKAMSAALKYALLQLFCIPTEEQKDSEYESHEVAPKEKPKPKPQNGVAGVGRRRCPDCARVLMVSKFHDNSMYCVDCRKAFKA